MGQSVILSAGTNARELFSENVDGTLVGNCQKSIIEGVLATYEHIS